MDHAAALALLRQGGRRAASVVTVDRVKRVRCLHCGAASELDGDDAVEEWLGPHDGTCAG